VFPARWRKLKALAHTLAYDATLVGRAGHGRPLPTGRWACVTVPTLVAVGAKSAVSMQNAMRSLAEVLPNAEHRTLAGQTHIVKSSALAPVLSEFFAD
jgi:pimeloyl-ACP methyl ester carboxylesterase